MVFALLGSLIDAVAAGRRAREKSVTPVTLNDDAPATAGDFRRPLAHKGDDRFYDMHVPASYRPGTAVPLVLVLHGGGGSPAAARNTSAMDAVAAREGFIVVYPSGTGPDAPDSRLTWNILKSGTYATAQGKDDLGFIRKVLDDVQRRFSIDPKRIYAAGISQGGMMCYRFACDPDLSARIAAIAPVAAVMTVDPSDCKPSRPMPIMHFHGLEDKIIPYAGGIGERMKRIDPTERPGVPETLTFWLKRNKLDEKPRDRGSRGKAGFEDFGREGAPGEFILWRMENGGHTWPGGGTGQPEIFIGNVNRDISASELMWKFFQRHQLP
jgi:polyhydroxybutyrate depolymerase